MKCNLLQINPKVFFWRYFNNSLNKGERQVQEGKVSMNWEKDQYRDKRGVTNIAPSQNQTTKQSMQLVPTVSPKSGEFPQAYRHGATMNYFPLFFASISSLSLEHITSQVLLQALKSCSKEGKRRCEEPPALAEHWHHPGLFHKYWLISVSHLKNSDAVGPDWLGPQSFKNITGWGFPGDLVV